MSLLQRHEGQRAGQARRRLTAPPAVAYPRLRQVALVARDLHAAQAELEGGLQLRQPFADPGVGQFGLVNAVYEAGSDFVEVVSPAQPDTAAGRQLDRRGDGGYMAIFQLGDFAALADVRRRLPSLGVRTVWQIDLDDIASSHLHPHDVPGAIVSIDAAEPPSSWRWGGPRWTAGPPADPFAAGGIASITVAVQDPTAVADRWAAVLGCDLDPLPSGQSVRFVAGDGGISEIVLEGDHDGVAKVGSAELRAIRSE